MSLGIEDVITRKRVCAIIGISTDTLKRWIKERGFPQPSHASGRSPIFDKKMVKCIGFNNLWSCADYMKNFFQIISFADLNCKAISIAKIIHNHLKDSTSASKEITIQTRRVRIFNREKLLSFEIL